MKALIQSLVKPAGATLAIAMIFALSFAPAHAQTSAQLQAQVSGTATASAEFTFTRDFTIGSTGPDVTALQQFLISKGQSIPAGATGYFGVQTRGALAAYQAAHAISPPAGYFGPITRNHINSLGGGVTTPNDDDFFSGNDEGFLDDFDQISALSSEEVGENEEDVEVLGVEFTAEDSDQMITRVTVEVDTPTGSNDDLDEYITEVALFLDGDELDRMDIDEASHNRSADRYTFRFTNLDGIVEEGETGELTVAVTGIRNLDSADEGKGWTIRIPEDGIRAVSPNGVDDNYDSSEFETTFTLDTFASASGVELQVSEGENSPEGGVVTVDSQSETEGVELLHIVLEAEGSDLTISELPITLTVTGATDVDALINRLTIEVNGDEFSENVVTSSSSASITFDDLDLVIDEGDEIEIIVMGDLNELGNGFDAGDGLTASLSATNRDNIEVEDQSGEELATSDKRGTANGEEITFFEEGINVTFVSAEESVSGEDGSDNDTGTFRIKFRVEAVGDTIYVSNDAAATTASDITASTVATNGVLYRIVTDGAATTDDLTAVVTDRSITGNVTDSTNGLRLDEGEVVELTLTIARTNDGDATDDGIFQSFVEAIGWNTDDSTTWNVYDFNLDDYRTNPLFLN